VLLARCTRHGGRSQTGTR